MIAPIQARVGLPVSIEGYADDFGNHIVALEFSLNGGETWAQQDTSASSAALSVHWTYQFTPKEKGEMLLLVRSIAEDGRRSPEPAAVRIFVE